MTLWYFITALGGMGVTGSLSVAIAAWLAAAHCRVRALYWCLLFGCAMVLVIATKIVFIGWGLGLPTVDFTGFSGHATRAAAVFPVAAYLLLIQRTRWQRSVGVAGAVLLAMLVAYSRVVVKAHSGSEAVLGCMLGLLTAAAFIGLVRALRDFVPHPLLIGLTVLAVVVLPRLEPEPSAGVSSQQFMTGVALHLSGHDRPYQRWNWKLARKPYVPPCSADRVHLRYLCI